MSFRIVFILLVFPLFLSAQFRKKKEAIRESTFVPSKAILDAIENKRGVTKMPQNPKDVKKLSRERSTILINNPNDESIKFAIGSTNEMEIIDLKPNTEWRSSAVQDLRFNFVLKTGNEVLRYAIENNHCYQIIWKSNKNRWDIETISCFAKKPK